MFTLLLIASALTAAQAQTFRADVVEILSIDGQLEQSVTMGAGDVVVLTPSDEIQFVRTLSVDVRLPRNAGLPPGTFSIEVFDRTDRDDEFGVTTLVGRRLLSHPISGTSVLVDIPIGEATARSGSVGVVQSDAADVSAGAIAVHLVPLSKGTATDIDAIEAEVSIAVRLRPVGAIAFEFDGEPAALEAAAPLLEVTVDGDPVDPDATSERAPGIYRVEASAGDYLQTVTNVGVEVGRTSVVQLRPEIPTATVRVTLPSVAEVFWNGTLMDRGVAFDVEPGLHTLMIRLGDYTVTRRLELDALQTYEIGLDLDISVDAD